MRVQNLIQIEHNKNGSQNRDNTTYKLPSYANCLRAQIRPKNFTALKDYYELLTKDAELAKFNKKHFFDAAKRRANTSMEPTIGRESTGLHDPRLMSFENKNGVHYTQTNSLE